MASAAPSIDSLIPWVRATVEENATDAVTRFLTESEEELKRKQFEEGIRVSQIFSSIVFGGIVLWLISSNATRLSFIQRASVEKRLSCCCYLNVYIISMSLFLNLFQLTEVDDIALPRQSQFTLDLARPIEWILTCPAMQMVLVIMAGTKIPEWRRWVMPSLSILVLVLGYASMFTRNVIWRSMFYGFGSLTALLMFFLNAKQIQEYTQGVETLWHGDSEYRKATVLLIVTWFLFPLWFILSPEGFELIDNILFIQSGWAFLNIMAKGTFALYIQRIKDLFCHKLKTQREMGTSKEGEAGKTYLVDESDDEAGDGEANEADGKLRAVVIETMTFLGMSMHSQSFLELLVRSNITTLQQVEALSTTECESRGLPVDLITALQRRLQSWKIDMGDDSQQKLVAALQGKFKQRRLSQDVNTMEGILPGSMKDQAKSPQSTYTDISVAARAPHKQVAGCLERGKANGKGESVDSDSESTGIDADRVLSEFMTGQLESKLGDFCSKVTEQISNQVRFLGGQLQGIEEKVSAQVAEVRSLKGHVSSVEEQVAGVSEKLVNVGAQITQSAHVQADFNTKLTRRLEEQSVDIASRFEDIGKDLANLIVQRVEHVQQSVCVSVRTETSDLSQKIANRLEAIEADNLLRQEDSQKIFFQKTQELMSATQNVGSETTLSLDRLSSKVDRQGSEFQSAVASQGEKVGSLIEAAMRQQKESLGTLSSRFASQFEVNIEKVEALIETQSRQQKENNSALSLRFQSLTEATSQISKTVAEGVIDAMREQLNKVDRQSTDFLQAFNLQSDRTENHLANQMRQQKEQAADLQLKYQHVVEGQHQLTERVIRGVADAFSDQLQRFDRHNNELLSALANQGEKFEAAITTQVRQQKDLSGDLAMRHQALIEAQSQIADKVNRNVMHSLEDQFKSASQKHEAQMDDLATKLTRRMSGDVLSPMLKKKGPFM